MNLYGYVKYPVREGTPILAKEVGNFIAEVRTIGQSWGFTLWFGDHSVCAAKSHKWSGEDACKAADHAMKLFVGVPTVTEEAL